MRSIDKQVIDSLQTGKSLAKPEDCIHAINLDFRQTVFGDQFCKDFFRKPQDYYAGRISLNDFVLNQSHDELVVLLKEITHNPDIENEISEPYQSILNHWNSETLENKNDFFNYLFSPTGSAYIFSKIPQEVLVATLFSFEYAKDLSRTSIEMLIDNIYPPCDENPYIDTLPHILRKILSQWDNQIFFNRKLALQHILDVTIANNQMYYQPTPWAKNRAVQLSLAKKWLASSIDWTGITPAQKNALIEATIRYGEQTVSGIAGIISLRALCPSFVLKLNTHDISLGENHDIKTRIFFDNGKLIYRCTTSIILSGPELIRFSPSLGNVQADFEVTTNGLIMLDWAFENPYIVTLLESKQADQDVEKQFQVVKHAFFDALNSDESCKTLPNLLCSCFSLNAKMHTTLYHQALNQFHFNDLRQLLSTEEFTVLFKTEYEALCKSDSFHRLRGKSTLQRGEALGNADQKLAHIALHMQRETNGRTAKAIKLLHNKIYLFQVLQSALNEILTTESPSQPQKAQWIFILQSLLDAINQKLTPKKTGVNFFPFSKAQSGNTNIFLARTLLLSVLNDVTALCPTSQTVAQTSKEKLTQTINDLCAMKSTILMHGEIENAYTALVHEFSQSIAALRH